MTIETKDNIIVEFNTHGGISEPITVRKTMSDNSMETIGHIYQNWSDEDISITYECRGIDGEEICPPTIEWIAAEQAFERYARQYHKESALEKSIDKGEIFKWYSGRQNETKAIRGNKKRNDRTIGITK